MRDWQIKWPPARPRWGTFSVQAHLDLQRLITDVLLYDALVFPTPVDDADVERWNENEWNPELLAFRINQLGDAAFATPWDPGLRATWSKEFQQLEREFPNDPTLAFDLTAAIMAEQSFARLVDPEDDRVEQVAADPPKLYPAFAARDARARLKVGGATLELVAAFQNVRQARRIAGAIGDDETRPLYPLPDEGVRLRLELAVPVGADEDTFHRALDIISDDNFRAARRRLWSWEEQISADRLDQAAIRLALDALVADYNAAVAGHGRETRQQSVFLLVPAGLGIALDIAVGGGVAGKVIGVGVNFVAHKVKAKFPTLGKTGDAVSHHPGSAVSRALSIMAHD